ncbi:hypothetical protein L596_002332 [Steinernema carpocapsae]|uniref:Uncharacterized protein n=1 Tax=Steinernema carpocapsae TaxID=34508 RepID=A0A4U8URL3_STECR|nr:hypothetical protein L596_002332 [Steinernema carpocapsae]
MTTLSMKRLRFERQMAVQSTSTDDEFQVLHFVLFFSVSTDVKGRFEVVLKVQLERFGQLLKSETFLLNLEQGSLQSKE